MDHAMEGVEYRESQWASFMVTVKLHRIIRCPVCRMSTNSHAEMASLSSGSSQQKQLTNELVQIAAPSISSNDMHQQNNCAAVRLCGAVVTDRHSYIPRVHRSPTAS